MVVPRSLCFSHENMPQQQRGALLRGALLLSLPLRAGAQNSTKKLYAPWNEQDDYKTTTIAGGTGAAQSLGSNDTVVKDGSGATATFLRPVALAVDSAAGELYVADKGSHRIRMIKVSSFANASDYVTTLAGSSRGYADGIGVAARFDEPTGLAIDPYTRLLFVADSANYVVRQIELDTGRTTTLAGAQGVVGFANGRGEAARFSYPTGLALALRSRQLFVCDPYNHAVRVVHVVSREVHTLAGTRVDGSSDGTGAAASFHRPQAAAVADDETVVYVADGSPRIRALQTTTVPSYPAAPGTSDAAAFSPAVTTLLDGTPLGLLEVAALSLAFGWPGGALMLADRRGDRVYKLGLGAATDTPAATDTAPQASGGGANSAGANSSAAAGGAAGGGGSTRRQLQTIQGALPAAEASAEIVVCPQAVPGFAKTGQACHPRLVLLAGSTPGYMDGMGINTRFYNPSGLAVEYLERALYVADTYNHRVRLIDLEDIPDEVVELREEWYQVLGRAFRQNLIFIIILCSSTLLLCCLVYLICRFCSLCPLHQRRLHKQRMSAMDIGLRGGL